MRTAPALVPVAVHDAGAAGGYKRFADLGGPVDQLVERQGAVAQSLAQALALQVLLDNVVTTGTSSIAAPGRNSFCPFLSNNDQYRYSHMK